MRTARRNHHAPVRTLLPRLAASLVALVAVLATFAAAAPAAMAADASGAGVDTTAAQRARAATIAVGRVGSPYRFGAAGPRRFDCSGLAVFSFTGAGKALGVRTSQEMWNIGAKIRRSALKRGDIVFTYDASKGHVGLYLGNGYYVHAPGEGRRVMRAALPTGADFIGAVRP